MKHLTYLSATVFIFACIFSGSVSAESCDRECLKEMMTKYIAAMESHSVDSLPLADEVKVTEDCEEIQAGEGYFNEYAGTIDYRLDIIDVRTGGSFAFLVVKNSGSKHLYAVRLKVADQKITQIETMIVKNSTEGMLFEPDNFSEHEDISMGSLVDSALRNTREEMLDMATKYPEGLKKGGTFQKNGVPFIRDAYRLENGMLMAGPGCTFFSGCDNIGTQSLPTLPAMVYQPALVDEEAGIVLIRMNFGEGSVMGDNANTLDVFESFKVFGDSVYAVRAFMQKISDSDDRSPENLFKWNYKEDVTALAAPRQALRIPQNGSLLQVPVSADHCTVELFSVSGRRLFSESAAVVSTDRLFRKARGAVPAGVYMARVSFTGGNRSVAPQRFTVSVP